MLYSHFLNCKEGMTVFLNLQNCCEDISLTVRSNMLMLAENQILFTFLWTWVLERSSSSCAMRNNMYMLLFWSFIYIWNVNWNSNINWNFLEYFQTEIVIFIRGKKFPFEGLGRGADSQYSLMQKYEEWETKQEETEKKEWSRGYRERQISLLSSVINFQNAEYTSSADLHGHWVI